MKAYVGYKHQHHTLNNTVNVTRVCSQPILNFFGNIVWLQLFFNSSSNFLKNTTTRVANSKPKFDQTKCPYGLKKFPDPQFCSTSDYFYLVV